MNNTPTAAIRTRDGGRGRAATGIRCTEIAILGIALVLLVLAAIGRPASLDPGRAHATTVRVDASDTLWEIASEYRVQGASVQETVAAIRKLNGMANSDLAEGQLLRVPDAGSPVVASR